MSDCRLGVLLYLGASVSQYVGYLGFNLIAFCGSFSFCDQFYLFHSFPFSGLLVVYLSCLAVESGRVLEATDEIAKGNVNGE